MPLHLVFTTSSCTGTQQMRFHREYSGSVHNAWKSAMLSIPKSESRSKATMETNVRPVQDHNNPGKIWVSSSERSAELRDGRSQRPWRLSFYFSSRVFLSCLSDRQGKLRNYRVDNDLTTSHSRIQARRNYRGLQWDAWNSFHKHGVMGVVCDV